MNFTMCCGDTEDKALWHATTQLAAPQLTGLTPSKTKFAHAFLKILAGKILWEGMQLQDRGLNQILHSPM